MTSYAVGAILGDRHDIGNSLSLEDLPLILGLLAKDAAIKGSIAPIVLSGLNDRHPKSSLQPLSLWLHYAPPGCPRAVDHGLHEH
jgi:hypothetical protein